jgi:molybdopterin-guanine dinucleotide biosynthesis protein A
LKTTAIILAGGSSARFGRDKGLLPLTNKPIIQHVLNATKELVDEQIIVVNSKTQAENYKQTLHTEANILIDAENIQTPLIGAFTGFEAAEGEYSLLLSCDVPFVSKNVLSLLLDLCPNRMAVIPRWPNGYIEPLQAVYATRSASKASRKTLSEGKLRMQTMIDNLHGVRYISTLVLEQLDPNLATFFNINTPVDLKKAEAMLAKKER